MNNQKKKIVIIGGSSGMGLSVAELLSTNGANVVIGGRDQNRINDAISLNPTIFHHGVVDIENDVSIRGFFATVAEFDHLVITGPSPSMHDFGTTLPSAAKEEFDSKFWGQYRAVHEAIKWIRPTGSITLTSGAYGVKPDPKSAVMAAANGAIEALVRALAVELAPLRVNAIAPGLIDTPLIRKAIPSEAIADVFAQQAETLLTRRVGQAEDVAVAVQMLISNNHITGSIIRIDGGFTLL